MWWEAFHKECYLYCFHSLKIKVPKGGSCSDVIKEQFLVPQKTFQWKGLKIYIFFA